MRYRRPCRLLPLLLVATCVGSALPSVAGAEPVVRVRAESRLTATLERVADGHELRGLLSDDLDVPLPNRAVTVSFARAGAVTQQLPLTTDAQGRIAARLGALEDVDVAISFAGDALHGGSDAPVAASAGRDGLVLHWGVEAGAVFDVGTPRHELEVGLLPAAGARGVRLSLRTDFGELGHAVTDAAGRARFTFGAARLGPARRTRLIASASASGGRAALREMRTIVVRTPTAVTLAADATGAPGEVHVEGLLTAASRALPDQAIALEAGERLLKTLETDADGRFEATVAIPATVAPGGELAIHARFESDAPWRAGARSGVVDVVIPPAPAPHPAWLLIPVALCLLLLMRYRPRGAERAHAEADAAARRAQPGFRTSGSRRLSWAGELGIAGRVVDLEHGGTVSGARVELRDGPGAPAELAIDRSGRFEAGQLRAGSYTIVASAPGYCEEQAHFDIPHRGQWSDLRVTLERLRNRAFEEYRPAGDAVGPGIGAAGVLTPQEILDHHRASGADRAPLAELVELVEEAVYGKTPPTEEHVDEIRRRSGVMEAESKGANNDGQDGGGKRATIPHQR